MSVRSKYPRISAWAARAALAAAMLGLPALAPGAAGQQAADRSAEDGQIKPWSLDLKSTPYGDYLAARHAENVHDPMLASQLLERILRHAPEDPQLLRQTLHQMVAAGRMDVAAEIARRYVAKDPDSVIASLTLAIEDIRARRYEDAAARLKAAPKRGLGGYIVPLALAWSLAGAGDTGDALEALEPFGERRGLKPLHDLHAALINDLGGETSRARSLFEELTGGDQLHPRIGELAAAFFERQGESAKARAIYEKLRDKERNTAATEGHLARLQASGRPPARAIASASDGAAEALWDLAILLNDQNVDEVALMLTRMALHLRPRFAMAQILLGDILEGMRRYEEAVAAYDGLPQDSPRIWDARLRAADTLARAERIEPALERLAAMARERPERADAVIARGDILRFKKRYEEALEAYDEAFARIGKPERRHWSLYYSRGISLERSKQWERAEKDFLKALELQPDQPFVLNYLGYSWVDQGMNLERALGMLERAVRLRPNDGFIVDSLGWAHYRLGSFDKAVKHLERATELSPADATINDHLGDAYWRVGRHAEARFQWQRALGLDPEPDTVEGIRKKLAEGLGEGPRKSDASGGGPGPRDG